MHSTRTMQRLRHSLACSLLLLLSSSSIEFMVQAQDAPSCALDIWIFSSFESCKASDGPVGNGVIYADGQCHTIETSISPNSTNYALFPGNYRVQCVDASKIHFFDSGCLDNQCSVSSLETGAVCDRDDTSPASLYSRLSPPEYAVQDPSNASVGALYTCLKLNNTVTSLTFVVFGDCSQCAFATTPPSTPPPVTAPPVAPSAPTPVTLSPTLSGTWSPTTLLPTPKWSLPNKTSTPVAAVAPSPTATPFSIALPVAVPVAAPVSVSVPSGEGSVNDSISVALRLSPMYQTMSQESSLIMWQNATLTQIRSTAENDFNVVVYSIAISNIEQELVDPATATGLGFHNGTSGRLLVENFALQVFFDLAMSYTPQSNDSTPPALSVIFHSAFDTEQERSNYLIKLVPNDEIFAPVRLIEVLVDGEATAAPVAAPTEDKTQTSANGGASIGLFVALAGGVSLIAVAVIGMIFYHRRKHAGGGSKKEVKTNGETPSDNDDEEDEYGGGPMNAGPQQRWTNEIVVDPSADDVSTLGGSVLLGGLHLDHGGGGNTGEDEPTASVNLDYDFNRNQYRSDLEDRSRTVATDGTGRFTHFSKLGMNGEGIFNDMDDQSFEKLYADIEDDDDGGAAQRLSSDIASRVKPFEVRAPPGKLGMVVDTPNGGVPVVRAIKTDSVLSGSIQVGDRLISVDHRDVTNMNALEVSSLISLKQHQTRLLIFCRLSPPTPNSQSQPSPVATNSTAS